MNEITILKMRAKKVELEAAINKLLTDFQNETGAKVHDIYLDKMQEMGVSMPTIFSHVEVKL